MTFICPPCRDAGSLATTARDASSRRAVETLRRELHGRCRGGTWCDCAHRSPSS